jgi:hypothetical protein
MIANASHGNGTSFWGGWDFTWTAGNCVHVHTYAGHAIQTPAWQLVGVLASQGVWQVEVSDMQNVSGSISAVVIPEGAHHLDLFFANREDPESVRSARHVQQAKMQEWIQHKADVMRTPLIGYSFRGADTSWSWKAAVSQYKYVHIYGHQNIYM